MKKLYLGILALSLPFMASAQEAFDALQMSQKELRGTARFQSMAGAFGALGGDISTLTQNPAGIGVYRSSDANVTMSVDMLNSKCGSLSNEQTRFNVDNVGYVGAINLDNDVMKTLNIGFSYNRQQDYNRHFKGTVGSIASSITNYIAAYTGNYTESDLAYNVSSMNPYYQTSAPWSSILSYNSYLINKNGSNWQGLYGDGTTGSGEFEVKRSGHTDEYSVNLGGNISNTVYWGLGFGITDLKYDNYVYYGETLTNAYVATGKNTGVITRGGADYGYENMLTTKGTGYNFKLGVIIKPVDELRFGLAFHTPTFYDLKDVYKTYAAFQFTPVNYTAYYGSNETGNKGDYDYVNYTINTPWRFIASMAGVIGRTAMVDVDYEYVGNQTMRVGDERRNNYSDVTDNVKNCMQATHIIRVGGEVRVTPNFSVRAGYSYQTSPVKSAVENNNWNVTTVSNNPSYEFDKTIQYITCGLGYHYKSFYADMAYVHQARKSQFNAFSPIVYSGGVEPNVYSEVKDNNNRISLTLGFRF